ncbi:MAG: hypothetical protein VX346_00445 [Planctomycetota bacterium]|nr:hypothetical protein [Planctomycetota bacterium]
MADETHDEDSVPEEELKDESTDRSEEKPAKKKRKRRSGKKPREVEAESESPDGAAADDEVSESSASDDEKSGEDTSDVEEAAKVEEPPPPPEPDDPTAVQALKDLGARLETNEEGNVWRVFFYEDHTDADVTKMHSLHSLKQVWVIGSKATAECVTQLREQFPNATVYA